MNRTLYEPEHEQWRESVRTFFEREVTPNYAQWVEEGMVPRSFFTKTSQLGLFSSAPEEFGGAGLNDFRYSSIFLEEAAKVDVAPAVTGVSLHADICLPYFLSLCNDEQKARWLPGIVSGELITAIAMTEPGTGSDLSAISTSAVLDHDEYVVNGAKTYITNGIHADLVIVVVRTGEHPHRGLSLLVCERGTKGFDRGRKLEKVGMHVQDTAELFFSDARVPAANLLGIEGEGFFNLTLNLGQERLQIAITSVAQAQSALEHTIDYVRERIVFGKPLANLQNTRFKLAEIATEIDIAQQFVDRCILELNSSTLDAVDAAKAKWWTTELLGRVVDACVQLHGGNGFMLEYPIARLYIDARASRIYGGTTEVMKEIIARGLKLD